MEISAKVVAASTYEGGKPIWSIQTVMPKWMLAELNTHRAFSRSSGSSRAVPISTMIRRVKAHPYIPIHMGKSQSGMQAREELTGAVREKAVGEWLWARDRAVEAAESFVALGLHKQVANRVLEPWMFIDTIITATEWNNFFELRDHPDAQPEMRRLAQCIKQAMAGVDPKVLKKGEWHLPYILDSERNALAEGDLLRLSTARCARVSYLKHDNSKPSLDEDFELYDRLVGTEPLHASPAEHQAQYNPLYSRNLGYHRNFHGWVQHRAILEDFHAEKLLGDL